MARPTPKDKKAEAPPPGYTVPLEEMFKERERERSWSKRRRT
jgi:hypothetical protein